MRIRTVLLGAAATLALTSSAFADDEAIMKRLDAMQRMIDVQQQQVQTQRDEIRVLRRQLGRRSSAASEPAQSQAAASTPSPPESVAERLDRQQAQIDTLAQATEQSRLAQQDQPVWSVTNWRPTIQSPDGRYSLGVRGLGQFDVANYMQGSDAKILSVGPDLSSGANFRRAQLGIGGKLFGDWSYLFNYEFGGSGGTESQGRVQSLYVEYDGFAPFAMRVGAYPAPAGLRTTRRRKTRCSSNARSRRMSCATPRAVTAATR